MVAFGSNSTFFAQEQFDLVIAKRPEHAAGDGNSARRAFVVIRRIELQEPRLALRVPCGESGMHAGGFLTGENPFRRIRRRAHVGTARHLLGCDRGRPNPVGKPVRVRHFVDRVDVLRPLARRLVIRRDEQVVGHLVNRLDVVICRSRRILRIRLTRDGIVSEEALALGRCIAAKGHTRDDNQKRQPGPAWKTWKE
jgi:hypothetical protein